MRKYIYLIATLAVSADSFAASGLVDSIHRVKEVEVVGTHPHTSRVGKLSVPLQHMPMSVTSVSATTLEGRGIVNIQDAVKFLPGTRMRTTYGAYQQFEVRGFDFTPIMIDGVRDERTSITNSAPLGDLSAVESIELLKGPASVLYGHSAVGGVVNVVRKAPTGERIANALISYGSWGNKRAMMDFGGKVAGPFDYRAVVNWSDNDGYRHTGDKRFSGYLALGAKFDHRQELDIRAGFNRDWYGTEIGLPRLMPGNVYRADGSPYLSQGSMLPGLDPRARFNNESDFMKNHAFNASVRYAGKVSEAFKIENRLAYNFDNIDYFSTEELSYLESNTPIYDHYYIKNDAKKYICLDSVQLTFPLRFAYTVHTINEQVEISGKVEFANGMKYNYLGGYNFVWFSRDTFRGYNGNNPETGAKYTLPELIFGPGLYSKVSVRDPHSMGYMDPHFNAGTSTRNLTNGVYLQNLVELSDIFKVMVAGRYDHFVFKTATAEIHPISKEREYTKRPPFDKTSTAALTYRVGAVCLPTSDLSLYASWANFFAPYRDIVNTATTIYIDSRGDRFYPASGEQAFKPQTGYQAELGARYSFNHVLQATASAFYIRRNNEKKTLKTKVEEDGATKNVVGVVGSSESKGFELELILTPTRGSMLSCGYGYTDATVRDLHKNDYMKAEPKKGMRLAGVPCHTFFAAGNYAIMQGVLKDLAFTATVTYTGDVDRDLDKTVVYPAHWLTDLGVSYKLNDVVRVRVNVNNVFNERYYNQSLSTQMVPSLPRNYLLTLSYAL